MTKVINAFLAVSEGTSTWERTPDGFLRTKARILKECVMPYGAEELGRENARKQFLQLYVPMESLTDATALRTLEGCPIVTWEHNWLDPENISDYGKGSVAGSGRIDGPYLEVDLLVTHPDAIADIEARKIGEISAAYHSEIDFTEGKFGEVEFDATQHSFKFNHIAIIPYGIGRAGIDVKILNKKQQAAQIENNEGGTQMGMIRVRLRNTGRVVNVAEEDAPAVEEENQKSESKDGEVKQAQEGKEKAEGESQEKGRSLEQAMAELEGKNSDMQKLQEEVDELKGELATYKAQLDKLLSGDGLEQIAEGMNEDQADAEEIIENVKPDDEKDEKEKEKIENCRFQVANTATGITKKPLRGEALYRSVMTACGVNVENMSADGVRAAFKSQAQIVRRMNNSKVAGKKTVNGTKVINSMSTAASDASTSNRTALQRLGYNVDAKK